MSQFKNVDVIKKANIYFNGKVSSRTLLFENGDKKTLGMVMPGEYEFATADKEIMEVLGGSFKLLLPTSSTWEEYGTGTEFVIPAHSSFKIKVDEVSDYCCSYIKE